MTGFDVIEIININCPCSVDKIKVVLGGGIQSIDDIKFCPKCGRQPIGYIPANHSKSVAGQQKSFRDRD